MFRILKKIQIYHRRFGFVRLVKILYLLFLAKVLARRFVKLSTNWRVQSLTLAGVVKHPVYIRPGTTDIEVMQQVLLDYEYDFKLPGRPQVIVDAGANIGLASVYFANRYPDAIIVSLEPDHSNFKLLEMNTAAYPQIRAVNAALWSENKQLNLFSPNGAHSGFCTLEKNSGSLQECGAVPAVTLDSLMHTQGLAMIDLLKLDIEGAEKEVFENSSGWIDKVNILLIELHDHYKPGCSRAFQEATEKFQPEIVSKGETILRMRLSAVN
jgi:FkbM family methyltransferase